MTNETKCQDARSHCWHVRWVPMPRATNMASDGEVCCWCGERRPLTATYHVMVSHGPHLQGEPYSLTRMP